MDFACRTVVEQVLGEFPMRWDFEVFENRFEDADGRPLWNMLMRSLEVVEAAT